MYVYTVHMPGHVCLNSLSEEIDRGIKYWFWREREDPLSIHPPLLCLPLPFFFLIHFFQAPRFYMCTWLWWLGAQCVCVSVYSSGLAPQNRWTMIFLPSLPSLASLMPNRIIDQGCQGWKRGKTTALFGSFWQPFTPLVHLHLFSKTIDASAMTWWIDWRMKQQ